MPKLKPEELESRRREIIDAARECFLRSGFHQTTTDEICRAASITPGGLYHYFASKEEIISAVIQQTSRDVAARMSEMIEEPHDEDATDLCYARECATAIQLLTIAPKLNHGIYNIGQGYATTNREVVATIRESIPGAKLEIKPGRGPRWKKDSYMDISRIKADVGYEPKYTLRSALEEYVGWLRENEE